MEKQINRRNHDTSVDINIQKASALPLVNPVNYAVEKTISLVYVRTKKEGRKKKNLRDDMLVKLHEGHLGIEKVKA